MAYPNGVRSGGFGDHLDGAGRAFGDAVAAALAVVEVDLVALARSQLDDGVVRADAVAVVAFEAVAAGHAAAGLVQGGRLVEPADDLVEGRGAARGVEHRPNGRRGVGEVPGVEPVVGGEFRSGRRPVLGAA